MPVLRYVAAPVIQPKQFRSSLPHFTLDGQPVKLSVVQPGVVVTAFSNYPLVMLIDIDGDQYQLRTDFDDTVVRSLEAVISTEDVHNPWLESMEELDIPVDHACLQYLHPLSEVELEVLFHGN